MLTNFRTETLEFISQNDSVEKNDTLPDPSSKEVYISLQLSKIVYEDLSNEKIKEKLNNLGEFDIIHGYQVHSIQDNVIAGVALIAMNQNYIFLSIRGSQTTRDHNLNFSPTFSYESFGEKETQFWVKSGFYSRFQCFKKGVTELKNFAKSKKKRLVFCGHSLGGAVAFLCGIHCMISKTNEDEFENSIKIITFGQPLVFRKENESKLDKLLMNRKDQMLLFMNEGDIVPEVTIARNLIPLSSSIFVFFSTFFGSMLLKHHKKIDMENNKHIFSFSFLSSILNFSVLYILEKLLISEFKLEPSGTRFILYNDKEVIFTPNDRNIFFNFSTIFHFIQKNISPHLIDTYEKNLSKYQEKNGDKRLLYYQYQDWTTDFDKDHPERKHDEITKSLDESESQFKGLLTVSGISILSTTVIYLSYKLFHTIKNKYFN